MQLLDEILNLIKQRRVSVEKLSIEAVIPASRIYGWVAKRGNPKGDDVVKLQNWHREYVQIHDNKNKVFEPVNEAKAPVTKESSATETDYQTMIAGLLDSNNKLATAALISAEAEKIKASTQKDIAQNTLQLTLLLFKGGANYLDNTQTISDLQVMNEALLKVLVDVSNGKKLKNFVEASLEVNKNVADALAKEGMMTH